MQVLGAISGAALVAALTPSDVYVGMGDGAPGCFDVKGAVNGNITKSQVFGWEVSAHVLQMFPPPARVCSADGGAAQRPEPCAEKLGAAQTTVLFKVS
jgi:hypothetical protein